MEENFLNLDKRKKNVLTVVEAVKGRSFFFFKFFNCWGLWKQRRITADSEARKIGGWGKWPEGETSIQAIQGSCWNKDLFSHKRTEKYGIICILIASVFSCFLT